MGEEEKSWVETVRPKADRLYTTTFAADSEAALLDGLLKGNSAQLVTPRVNALPAGCSYRPLMQRASYARTHEAGPTIAFHAHPSDISGDFASYAIMHTNGFGEFRQVIVTRGEETKAKDRYADIIAQRMEEERRSSKLLKIKTDYLKTTDKEFFSDSKLLENLPELKERMKAYIREAHPSRIILPSPWQDHPDHLAVYIAGMNAILDLKNEKENFFTKNKIEIVACEPEFGVAARASAQARIPKVYGGLLDANGTSGIDYYPYKYHMDEDGTVQPDHDITRRHQKEEVPEIAHHPVAVPPYIVSVSPDMVKLKLTAMLQHESQMEQTNYAKLIPALDRLRGLMTKKEWGVGIYPIHIPGVTDGGPSLVDSLAEGSIFQLHKNTRAQSAVHFPVKRPANHIGSGI